MSEDCIVRCRTEEGGADERTKGWNETRERGRRKRTMVLSALRPSEDHVNASRDRLSRRLKKTINSQSSLRRKSRLSELVSNSRSARACAFGLVALEGRNNEIIPDKAGHTTKLEGRSSSSSRSPKPVVQSARQTKPKVSLEISRSVLSHSSPNTTNPKTTHLTTFSSPPLTNLFPTSL